VARITKNTEFRITLGFLFIVGVGVWKLAFAITDFTKRVDNLELSSQTRWSYQMMRDFTNQLKYDNPDLKVPDYEKIRRRNLPLLHQP
jgi:hypothetical protein